MNHKLNKITFIQKNIRIKKIYSDFKKICQYYYLLYINLNLEIYYIILIK